MNKKGSLVVISGFSGVGKGTVVKHMLEKDANYRLSVSCTSRPPRPGEEHGKSYFFITRDEFEEMIRDGALTEYTEYCGNYYGTPKAFLDEEMSLGHNIILEIEVNGALNIRKQYPDAVLIYIMPPSAGALWERLAERGSEEEGVRVRRIRRAAEEAEYIESYDYVIVNRDGEAGSCADEILTLIRALTHRVSLNKDFIAQTREQIQTFMKGEEL